MRIIRKLLKVVIVLAFLVALVLASGYFLIKNHVITINQYFLPENPIMGVDVSAYQGEVDMEALADQGVKFVYLKATEGSSHKDEAFAQNWLKAKQSPLYYGAYHFFSFDSSGKTQADNFIQTMGRVDSDRVLIPAVDIEYYADKKQSPPEQESVIKELREFLTAVEKYYGVKPLLYSGRDINERYLREAFADYPRWISNLYLPVMLDYGQEWTIWQYSDRGKLAGYADEQEYIDLNILNPKLSLDDYTIFGKR